jgi:hypothetical protein
VYWFVEAYETGLSYQVAWLYWPEELPRPETKTTDTVNSMSGQRKYHSELIASNQGWSAFDF